MGPWNRMVQGIARKVAFFPPPPTYTIEEHADETNELYIDPVDSRASRVPQAVVKRIETQPTADNEGGRQKIVTAWLPYSRGADVKKGKTMTILFSHGNAVDLGLLLPFLRDLGRALKVNVMGYDYTGYGCSTGGGGASGLDEGDLPSVGHCYSDITAVYKHLVNDLNIPPRSIILYGQSVGSGPTSYLGAQLTRAELGGVVLHTPLFSGVRVLFPNWSYWPSWLDVFPNHLHVPEIEVPCLVLHGTADDVIDVSCGRKIAALCKFGGDHLFPEGYNHQNLETCPEYLPTLQKFMDRVAEGAEEDLPSPPADNKGKGRGSCL